MCMRMEKIDDELFSEDGDANWRSRERVRYAMGEAKKLWGKMKERVGLEEIRQREDRESWRRFGGRDNEEVKKEEEMSQE